MKFQRLELPICVGYPTEAKVFNRQLKKYYPIKVFVSLFETLIGKGVTFVLSKSRTMSVESRKGVLFLDNEVTKIREIYLGFLGRNGCVFHPQLSKYHFSITNNCDI